MMSESNRPPRVHDIPITQLVPPAHIRKVSRVYRERLKGSLRAVGLIDPLIVSPRGDVYEIEDGVIRYQILMEMAVETVPCLLGDPGSENSNHRRLSAVQELRMLRRSLEFLGEETIAGAIDEHAERNDLADD